MSDITVITSITGGKDHLRDDQRTEGARFIAYVSGPRGSAVWEERRAYDRFRSDRRNSRAPKMLSHHFCDTPCSIWLDGNMALKEAPTRIVAEWLDEYDLAVFKHPERACLYDEARVCVEHRFDDPDLIKGQVKKYQAQGFAKQKGLAECNVIARRHTPKVVEFNNAWWSEYCTHSARDQISFMYVADKVGLRINWITPAARPGGHAYFDSRAHLTPRGEPQHHL